MKRLVTLLWLIDVFYLLPMKSISKVYVFTVDGDCVAHFFHRNCPVVHALGKKSFCRGTHVMTKYTRVKLHIHVLHVRHTHLFLRESRSCVCLHTPTRKYVHVHKYINSTLIMISVRNESWLIDKDPALRCSSTFLLLAIDLLVLRCEVRIL